MSRRALLCPVTCTIDCDPITVMLGADKSMPSRAAFSCAATVPEDAWKLAESVVCEPESPAPVVPHIAVACGSLDAAVATHADVIAAKPVEKSFAHGREKTVSQ